VVDKRSCGAALHYFTGSRDHNVAIRKRGSERGLRINEYGVFRLPSEERAGKARGKDAGEPVGGETEEGPREIVELAGSQHK
jgi:DNA polymerase/3'-5' exonuclease PolX